MSDTENKIIKNISGVNARIRKVSKDKRTSADEFFNSVKGKSGDFGNIPPGKTKAAVPKKPPKKRKAPPKTEPAIPENEKSETGIQKNATQETAFPAGLNIMDIPKAPPVNPDDAELKDPPAKDTVTSDYALGTIADIYSSSAPVFIGPLCNYLLAAIEEENWVELWHPQDSALQILGVNPIQATTEQVIEKVRELIAPFGKPEGYWQVKDPILFLNRLSLAHVMLGLKEGTDIPFFRDVTAFSMTAATLNGRQSLITGQVQASSPEQLFFMFDQLRPSGFEAGAWDWTNVLSDAAIHYVAKTFTFHENLVLPKELASINDVMDSFLSPDAKAIKQKTLNAFLKYYNGEPNPSEAEDPAVARQIEKVNTLAEYAQVARANFFEQQWPRIVDVFQRLGCDVADIDKLAEIP